MQLSNDVKNRAVRTFGVLVALAAGALGADEAGFVRWSGADLASYDKKLAAKINAQKVATENLSNFGNHLTMIAHREGDGEAELHEQMADLFVVQSGEATLVYGGEVANAKTTAPHELRGPSIKGGKPQQLTAGDVVHIPAGMPHQLLVPKRFTYFVIKVSK
jgi:mannose-6-phosphate isomerase-like protein (cupin superfamily)